MRPVKKIRAGIPPFSVIGKIIQSNQKAVHQESKRSKKRNNAPFFTWLTDTDASIQPHFLLSSNDGKIYTVRNIGNQLELSSGAVDYGILSMHTPVLMITSNTDNQSVSQFMTGYQQLSPEAQTQFEGLKNALGEPGKFKEGKTADFDEQLLTNIEKNIDFQVAQAISRYEKRIVTGRLVVVGSILDLDNQYGRGEGRLILINVNGETNAEGLHKMQIMTQIPPELVNSYVGRERQQKRHRNPAREPARINH